MKRRYRKKPYRGPRKPQRFEFEGEQTSTEIPFPEMPEIQEQVNAPVDPVNPGNSMAGIMEKLNEILAKLDDLKNQPARMG